MSLEFAVCRPKFIIELLKPKFVVTFDLFSSVLQSDYLRKISLKMLTMETKSQNPMSNSLQSNAASNNKNPQDPGKETYIVKKNLLLLKLSLFSPI